MKVKGYLEILGPRQRLREVIRQELREVKEQFATPRRTAIEELNSRPIEALIQREDMVVTVSHAGHQARAALGLSGATRLRPRAGMAVRDE